MTENANAILERAADLLDIPRSYYEKAAARHQSLGEWFCRDTSVIAKYDPTVYPQGSFRLGTVIRPLLAGEEYDLDVVCQLRKLGKSVLAQRELKQLVGNEVKAYAKAKGIDEPVIERKRCWRLDYADEVDFHIDTLPCVTEDAAVVAALVRLGVDQALAKMAIAITCKTHPNYAVVSSDWPMSNPGGYGVWFERRMGISATERRRALFAAGGYASVEQVPTYALKTPLQRSIQILKRHRDVMFRDDPDGKPISIIITTLSALAYEGERRVGEALDGVLARMMTHVRASKPRVPNPVNPGEDFADKCAKDSRLEQNFRDWHAQASADLRALTSARDATQLSRRLEENFGLTISDQEARTLAAQPPGPPHGPPRPPHNPPGPPHNPPGPPEPPRPPGPRPVG